MSSTVVGFLAFCFEPFVSVSVFACSPDFGISKRENWIFDVLLVFGQWPLANFKNHYSTLG